MTSEIETLKTNEFLRRRKLRLQQVREQSKDIAKKIRQRAKVETLRQVVDLDAKKQKEYFDRQEKLVKHLEVLYTRGLNNVGASHQSASELTQDGVIKTDLSKLRGREAAAEVRKKRQEKLDQQKKLLDRKLQARETANIISREKSGAVASKLTKATVSKSEGSTQKPEESEVLNTCTPNINNDEHQTMKKNDMATQWEAETMPNEWEPVVPALVLPKDDQGALNQDEQVSKSDKSKKLDLFAVSKEMPADLCGQHVHVSDRRDMTRPSLTLVSEYLQTRKLRLREAEAPNIHKKHDDISSLKQTILRTRTSKPEGKGTTCGDSSKANHVLNKKCSVTMYNHNTRDIRDLPYSDEQLVVRDEQTEEDAYAQAQKESAQIHLKEKEHEKKIHNMRNKVALTKQTVEKEYKDTINFLNALPKDKGNRVTKTAYMDERRQQMQNENRQHRMQQEYRKIEKECRRHRPCMKKCRKPISPSNQDMDDDFDIRDFQYSWMPVPEGDGNLAIHTIPNSVKEGKSGNTVKFSKVDSYHEYRSRHKHTPPTKDTAHHENVPYKNKQEPAVHTKTASQSSDDSSTVSDTSSIENLRLHEKETKNRHDAKLNKDTSDTERIIIYKILDTRSDKQSKKKNKLLSDIAKSLTSIEKVQKSVIEDNKGEPIVRQHAKSGKPDTSINFEHINEGVYKIAEEKKDNMASAFLSNDHPETPPISEDDSHVDQCKKLTKSIQRGTAPEWESGCIPQPERPPKSCHCPNPCRENVVSSDVNTNTASTSVKQPQTSSTASSFKTANNEKTKNVPFDSNYMKLVDEAGLESGKFFLGNTGFLKDNTYEVVIQLRKKDNLKEDEKVMEPVLPEQNKQSSTEKANTEIIKSINLLTSESENSPPLNLEADNVLLEFAGNRSEKISNDVGTTTSLEEESGQIDPNKDQNIPSNTNETCRQKTFDEKKNFSDKSTTTTLPNDYPIPISRCELPSRPATTTYTQTTNSPTHRPVYIHMSSSTSTAYMSPPDMILPNFLKHDSRLTDSETCELSNVDTIRKSVQSEKNIKKCRHARKVGKDNMKTTQCRKYKHQNTPPNSLRSLYKNADNGSTSSKNFKHVKCKCYNCSSWIRDQVKKQHSKNNLFAFESFRTCQNYNLLTGKKGSGNNTSRPDKARRRLNPIIKGYINKLLVLNKEGLKALEVANQECSSVGTPGSSIINVPHNIDERKSSKGKKISLEHIKQTFIQQIMNEHLNSYLNESIPRPTFASPSKKYVQRKPRRKIVHKVKSLNISKHLLKKNKFEEPKSTNHVSISTTTEDYNKSIASSNPNRSRLQSSPSSRQGQSRRSCSTFKQYNAAELNHKKKINSTHMKKTEIIIPQLIKQRMPQNETVSDTSHGTESTKESHHYYKNKPDIASGMSTQTSQNLDSDFMKLAEDKLNNMEKIADLTEKCTKRLSNLAKVLEEVRKNKSLVYSQISSSDSTDSHSDHKSEKVVKTPVHIDLDDVPNTFDIKSPEPIPEKECIPVTEKEKSPLEFIPFLTNIPKPCQLLEPNTINPIPSNIPNIIRPIPVAPNIHQHNINTSEFMKCRQKPPPALSRIHLKHGHEDIVPHELSTVIEVDSPMSIKNKTQSSRRNDPNTSNRSSNEDKEPTKSNKTSDTFKDKENIVNPDLLQNNPRIPKPKFTSAESSDDSKFQMIDLKHFNEIMLEPFISINEYAKKYNIEAPEEMSNVEDLQREDAVNDDISSLHSDGSLPDVIAELLKRNIITEPFKFDTASNVNSTTISSESTLSMLALSKARKSKKRANVMFQNKENIGETSDTLSISSNPDLENAFKKLGMGWASSTLKKTKERLALSSSSNTSSSSLSHLKIKSFHHDIPALVSDSVASVLLPKKDIVDNSKDAKHQKSYPNSMTVNEFLANELANKITFTNKSGINDTEEEFVSLFETKMPEGMNQQTLVNSDQHSNDSVQSGVNRARTSTPVQIFKSMTYHSSSGSNTSNGLFSNADDLSSVKMTSNSKNQSTSDRDELTIPNFSLKMKKGIDSSKSD